MMKTQELPLGFRLKRPPQQVTTIEDYKLWKWSPSEAALREIKQRWAAQGVLVMTGYSCTC